MAILRPSAEPSPVRTSSGGLMQMLDEAVEYNFAHALCGSVDPWTPLAELQAKHLLTRPRLQQLAPTLMTLRGQIAAEREINEPRPDQQPLHAGFIDLPQKLLDSHRRKGESSELGRVLALAAMLRDQVDRVVLLGAGTASLAPRALFDAVLPAYHNDLPASARLGRPRCYFEGDGLDSDALQELLAMLENTCIDPDLREERWGAIVIGRDSEALETAVAFRLFRSEAARFYGSHSPLLKQVIVPVAPGKGTMRELFRADGYADEDILPVPDNVGRFGALSAAGLLPAAVMGLDVRALLLGAASMTRRFLEEPFERNPVLQMAAVNYLSATELGQNVRVFAVWSRKLEALGRWYEHLIAESLGKQGRGPTPLTAVMPRDLHNRGQLHQEGPRDKMITNVVVRSARSQPLAIGMADRNEDGLNAIARKTHADLQAASLQAVNQALHDVARPTTELMLPTLSEHVLGQLMQMLMLATVVEGRLMGLNPYSEPGLRPYRQHLKSALGMG